MAEHRAMSSHRCLTQARCQFSVCGCVAAVAQQDDNVPRPWNRASNTRNSLA